MHRDAIHLADIIKSARMIQEYVSGASRQNFLGNNQLQDSVIRRFEIIGEAAGRVSQRLRDGSPDVPWSEMRGMRNRVIHRYDDIDMDIVWDTVEQDIPRLITQLERLVEEERS